MKASLIKQKQGFTAKIHGETVSGNVFKTPDHLYLCFNDNSHDGSTSPDRLGYERSWAIRITEGIVAFSADSVTSFKLNDKPYVKPIPPLAVAGYKVDISGEKVKFGCGEVTLTKDQIRDFMKMRELIKKETYNNYAEVQRELNRRSIILRSTDLAAIKKILA